MVILHNLSFQLLPFHLMFRSEKSTKKKNPVLERSLRIILNDHESPYSILLEETH